MASRVHPLPAMPSTPKFVLAAALVSVASVGTAGAESLTAQEQEMVALLNQARVDARLAPLQVDAGLSSIARAHSLDMAITGFFSHSSPTTGDMGDRLSAAGIDFRAAGENIALNGEVASAHQSLLGSAAHRDNILSPDVTHLGVGIVSNGRTLLVTQLFVRPGARFTARIPTIDPLVAEAAPSEVRRVQPRVQPLAPDSAEGCDGWDDEEYDEDEDVDDDLAAGPPPITIVPLERLPAAQQIPTLQVRPMPMPTPAPHAPSIGRGFWILGPRGNWVQVRVQPMPIQRRAVPQTRFLY